MNTFKAISGAGLAIVIVACSSTSAKQPPNTPSSGGAVEASAAQAGTTAATTVAESSPPRAPGQVAPSFYRGDSVVRVPEAVQHDPEDLMTLMQQVRSQIVYKTKKIPGPEYEKVVRPSIVDQLREAGFHETDIEQILAGVDYSRNIQNIR